MTDHPTEHDGTWDQANQDHVHTVECSPAPDLTAGAAFALYHYRTAEYGSAATTDEYKHFWHDMTDEERSPYVDDARVAVAGVMAVVVSASKAGQN